MSHLTIQDFYKQHEIDTSFDEKFYESTFKDISAEGLKSFYQPFCKENGFSEKQRLYYHYYYFGIQQGKGKNAKDLDKKVSVIIACKNRYANLLKILPSWLDNDIIDEIVIVDYGSAQSLARSTRLSQIKNFDKVKIISVRGEEFFNLGKAYNLAFDFTKHPYILKIDCDYQNLDISGIEYYLYSTNPKEYFLRGDFNFSLYTSGFFMIHREHYDYFREDFNGYGYDEIDLYERIKKKFDLKEIIWMDIDKYIYHIPHEMEERSVNYRNKDTKSSEDKNKKLSELFTSDYVPRNSYSVNNNVVKYDKQRYEKYCINLDHRTDRWGNFKKFSDLKRFSAIDKSKKSISLPLKPSCLLYHIYFRLNPSAYYCYLSHYSMWKKIVDEGIEHCLIIEDDISADSYETILQSNLILDNFDIINLSPRIEIDNDRYLFNGAESYILSWRGAKKLLNITHNQEILQNVLPQSDKRIDGLDYISWPYGNAITAPLDKFIGHCCEKSVPESDRLKSYLYPITSLDNTSAISDICTKNVTQTWEMDDNQIISLCRDYKK